MIAFFGLFLLIVTVVANERSLRQEIDELIWLGYKIKYGKFYTDEGEAEHRISFFKNLRLIQEHEARRGDSRSGHRLGIGPLTDITRREAAVKASCYKHVNDTNAMLRAGGQPWYPPMNVEVAESVDWRTKSLVTPVKDQQQCGSCYSFSATGALEGQIARFTGSLPDLSEQNIVDCSQKQGNQGCHGGLMSYVFQYVKENNGIDTETSYPYVGEEQTCQFNADTVGGHDSGYKFTPVGDEEALKLAVATEGPISVAIAVDDAFYQYKSGIHYNADCGKELGHAVLVVGYGTDPNDGDYWIVKNSWGTGWGDDGYILMARNRDNNCGIASYPVFPIYSA